MDYKERQEQYEKFKNVAYYIIIAVISMVSVAFLPFIGSMLTGVFVWPVGFIGWAIWITTKLLVATINILIFYCFLAQAKVNIKDDKNYLEAVEILKKVEKYKNLKPHSPKQYFGRIWSSKGVTLFITSVLSSIVLAEALLVFDLASFLAFIFTTFMAIIFGYLQMRSSEEYWISEYLAYAKDTLAQLELTKTGG